MVSFLYLVKLDNSTSWRVRPFHFNKILNVCFITYYCNFQVIAVNGKFPGPILNVTTNYNVVVNVKNKLDEDLLITWYVFIHSILFSTILAELHLNIFFFFCSLLRV